MSDLVYEIQGKVAWLRLSCPGQGNRLTPLMDQEIAAACQAIEEDEAVEIGVRLGPQLL